MSDYWKKRMDELDEKLKKEAQKKKAGGTTVTGPSASTIKKTKSASSTLKDERDIAPVLKKFTPTTTVAPTVTTKKTESKSKKKKDDDRTWFKKGAFSDGYQFGDVTKTLLGTAADVGENLGTGIIGMGERAVDALTMLGSTMGNSQMSQLSNDELAFKALTGKSKQADKTVKKYDTLQKDAKKGATEFVKKDLYDEEKISKKILTAPFEKRTGISTEAASILGEKSDSLVQSAGQLLATAGLNAVGVPWFLTTGATSFGAESENALNQGATYEQASTSALISAGAEVLLEKVSGGIKFGGNTLDDIIVKPFVDKIANKFVKKAVSLGLDAVGEAGEEWWSENFSRIGQWLTYQDDKSLAEMLWSEEAMDSKIEAAIGGGLLGGFANGVRAVANRNRIKLTENEQKVVDRVIEDRIAEMVKNGEKPGKRAKDKIYYDVIKALDEGDIDTDTIESVLGGDTYKTYSDTVEREDAIFKRFDELGSKTDATLKEQAEYKKLSEMAEELKKANRRGKLKELLGNEVFSLVRDSRLAESYNEKARRREGFKADLTKYDEKRQEIIKKAAESGILNNTRKTHRFVDFIAKISADKGVSFDFTSNEKLKESGFAIEGRTVNGIVTKDGIQINVNSARALNSVVGHEITHILEGTELYSELQTMLKAVAESKGEYQSRYDEITELYEDIEDADIEKELTADLVGDYLFSDEDFIRRLSAEKPGVFKKIFDEIKYLCRVATAGSKEAKELEKVKKTFEELYRESGAEKNTAEGGVRYSLNIQHSNGTVEELADARNITDEQVLSYLAKAKTGELKGHTYIPVRKDTPQVIIDTLKQVGENVDNLSLVMSVNKARQAMSNKDKSGVSKNKSDNIRSHSLKPEEILEIIKGLDEPSLMIYQTERYDKYGKELPNNVAVFVEFNNGEKEGMAVVEFDSEFDNYTIGNEFGETQYHTVVTVFEPDTIRNGEEYDYAQELLENPNNIELEIRRRQFDESATREKHPNTFEELPSSTDSIPNSTENVKQKDVFGFKINENADVDEDLLEELSIYHPDAEVDSEGNVTVYHRTSKANAEKIRKTGIMTALEDALFFSSKSEGYASDYGDTVLAFKIPSTVLRVNDIFDGEVHFDVPLKRMNNQWSMNVSKYLVDEGTAESYSLSSKDTTPKKHGDYAVYGEDVMLEGEAKPTGKREFTAPTRESIAEGKKKAITGAPMREDYSPEYEYLDYEFPMVDDVATVSREQIADMQREDRETAESITDADMPPEIDAPIYSADTTSIKEKPLKDISAMARDILFLTPKERRAIEDVVQKYSTSEVQSEEDLFNEIKKLFGEKTFEERIEEVYEIQRILRGYKINVSPSIKRDIADYPHFRRRNFGKIIFSNEGQSVDTAYMELAAAYPNFFPPDIVNPSDQLQQMSAVANMIKKETMTYELDDDVIREATETITDAVSSYKEKQLLKTTEREGRAILRDELKKDKEEEKARREAEREAEREAKPTRAKLHSSIVERIKTTFAEKGFDFDKVLSSAKNLSTFSTVDNTPQRVIEKTLGYKPGQILADETVNKVAQNESEGIRWLNSYLDRKRGILAQISKQYKIKPGSKESAAAQKYAEGFYVDEKHKDKPIYKYDDAQLAKEFPDLETQERIKGLATDERIRQIYDETLEAINESRRRNLYPEIPRRDNYFLHFRAMDDTFSRLGLPFNPDDIKAKNLPADLNGVTADLKPGQPYFPSAKPRKGKRTTFDLLGGLERYLTSAKNQIYHIDDIQTLRAVRNYIADTFGQANGLGNLDSLTEEEAQERIKEVYNSHLSTFAKFLNEEANVLAGKTSLIDRGLEGMFGREAITFFNTVNGQVGSNMVGFNISSSLTNFLPVVQTIAKTNEGDFVRALAQTAANKLNSLKGKSDGFKENSPVIIRRKGAERFYRTPYQKIGDAGYILMSAVDDVSTEIIARTKYNELTRKGMDEQQAHFETDKWVSRLMGDRSLGQMPQLYNSKMLGIVTKFQLEVRNQLDSMFYDTVQEAKVSNEEIESKLLRNAKTAAKVATTFFELAVLQHGFGWAFEKVAGYNPAFDIIEAMIKTFGLDDDEDDEDTALDNIEEGFFALLEDLPYTGTLTGGRIPISSALPINEFIKGKDQYGNEKSRKKTLIDAAPYYLLPTGFGQIKKSAKGLKMFDKDLPIAGSYTDSGNLRFPVDKTPGSVLQAAVFGQYANKNAQTYFDEGYAPLTEKQIQEYKDLGLPIADYWKIKEGQGRLTPVEGKKAVSMDQKAEYISSLGLPIDKKLVLKSYLYDEEEYKKENPEKYAFLEKEGIGYIGYKELDEETQQSWLWAFKHQDEYRYYKEKGVYPEDYSVYQVPMLDFDDEENKAYEWAFDYPEKATFGAVFSDGIKEYRKYANDLYEIRADKNSEGKSISGSAKRKKEAYIWSLDIDEGAKYILFKNEYKSDNTYNGAIIDYLLSRNDISYEKKKTILTELDFDIDDQGNISWD